MTVRVLLVLGNNLGWRTYSSTLVEALAHRDDIEVALVGGGQAAAGMGRGRATSTHHRELTRVLRDGRLVPGLRRQLADLRPELVHAAGHLMARPVLWARALPPDMPLSVVVDGTARQSDEAKGTSGRLGRWAWRDESRILARADLVNCVSDWAARSVIDDYGVATSDVRIRPHPIADAPEAIRRQATDRRAGMADEPVRLLFVGGDFERKGGPWLLDAYARHWGDNARLDVVSDTAPDGPVPDGVTIHRGVDNRRLRDEFLPGADVLVHPTRFDQSSLVAIEASAFSVPSVVNAVGGVGEVVDDGHTGFVASDRKGFVTGVDRLIADPVRRHRMGDASRQRFLELHEADGAVDRLVDDWKALVGQGGGRVS